MKATERVEKLLVNSFPKGSAEINGDKLKFTFESGVSIDFGVKRENHIVEVTFHGGRSRLSTNAKHKYYSYDNKNFIYKVGLIHDDKLKKSNGTKMKNKIKSIVGSAVTVKYSHDTISFQVTADKGLEVAKLLSEVN